jgi:5S rRNA maturation endonuclease (ribonuclease M5)
MGEINLNSFVYNEQITKEDIFSHIPQEEIYAHYIGEPVEHSTKICSPLRDDNVPSFAFYYHRNNSGTLMFYDFATKDSGDAIIFVALLFGIGFKDALWKIAYDFNLSSLEITPERQLIIQAKRLIQKQQVKIGIKQREWQRHDATFWKSFGITKATLEKYNVVPIQYVFFNGDASKVDKHAYAYIEFKDKEVSYKIYQPFSAEYKWINNANYTVHQGYTKLPKKGDLLIITKSLKDVMSLRDVMKIPSIGLQSESVMMKDSVMDEYKSRFKKVICLFDNDAAGIKLSTEFSSRYNVPHFFIPKITESVTDFSDMVKEIGVDKSKITFKQIFNEIRW